MGLTQKDIASLLNINTTKRIILWEQGKALPCLRTIFRLSIIYHVLPTDLYPEYYFELKKQLHPKTEDLLLNKHFKK